MAAQIVLFAPLVSALWNVPSLVSPAPDSTVIAPEVVMRTSLTKIGSQGPATSETAQFAVNQSARSGPTIISGSVVIVMKTRLGKLRDRAATFLESARRLSILP